MLQPATDKSQDDGTKHLVIKPVNNRFYIDTKRRYSMEAFVFLSLYVSDPVHSLLLFFESYSFSFLIDVQKIVEANLPPGAEARSRRCIVWYSGIDLAFF